VGVRLSGEGDRGGLSGETAGYVLYLFYMSRHLDGSIKPVDPIWYRQHEVLHLRCRCGHQARAMVGVLALQSGLSGQQHLWELVERLRCSRCGARHPEVKILSH
jgi:hypothetical protein